ncbi:hypothetical protein DFH09DRAFT_1080018 [Mycena vulgaris]|nr:hypothetical protein DFH09DRAFT_1080018 [Mycena vulgaris]
MFFTFYLAERNSSFAVCIEKSLADVRERRIQILFYTPRAGHLDTTDRDKIQGLEVHSQPVSLGEVPGNIFSVQLRANRSFFRVPAAISASQNKAPKWPPTLLCRAPVRTLGLFPAAFNLAASFHLKFMTNDPQCQFSFEIGGAVYKFPPRRSTAQHLFNAVRVARDWVGRSGLGLRRILGSTQALTAQEGPRLEGAVLDVKFGDPWQLQ